MDASELENFILLRFKKFLFERDFFSYSEPINDRLFLFGGREQYAKGIVDRSITGDHSGVFGLRKSGKTSVLNAIKQELDQREIFYISYRCIEIIIYNWYQALDRIARDAYKKCEKNLSTKEYTELNAMESFISDINTLLKIQNFSRIVLIFDEIEQIAFDSTFNEKWQDSVSFHYFWSTFITFCEKFNGKLSLIIAGINPSISEIDFLPVKEGKISPRNPMYKKLSNNNYLKPFVFEQIKRMVNELGKYMGLSFDDDVCFELSKDFGGHPFFTRQMCKVINQHIKDENLRKGGEYLFIIQRPLYNAVKDGGIFEVESIQWCKDILKELKDFYSDEYQMLLKIANKDITAASQVKRNQSIIPHLLGYGLIRFDNASREMDINIDIIRQYLISEKEYQKPFSEMTKSEIDTEIQKGIEECEQPLRNLIADVVSTLYIPSDAEEFIKSTFSYIRDNRGRDIQTLNLRQLLDPSLATLHFYVLKDIMCSSSKDKYGDHFEKFKVKLHPYTKREIQSYLDNIYAARNPVDHHYNVFNEGTLINFRGSISEIKKILKDRGYIL
ncbi:ATP-binding protein [Clostridium sp.]|uniref:ATP-binding protein n=1 Tax=Clostridium sp. TaxID=1506 RepID=UPI00284E66B1|nr:ATP-binding protein [Clostridium sp.]MDR3594563.1 ATP-binding protein [Clostridium sp.]